MKIMVASSFPERFNLNLGIASDLADGFGQVLGPEHVGLEPFLSVSDRVAARRPDLLVLVGSVAAVESNIPALAAVCRRVGTRFAFWTVEDPFEFDLNYRVTEYADIVFSNDIGAVPFYRRDDVHHLPTAAAQREFRPIGGFADRQRDIFFCGVGFPNRQVLVRDLLPELQRHRSLIIGNNWPRLDGSVIVNKRVERDLLPDYYSTSRIVLNINRTFSISNRTHALQAVTPGPRTFEAAMAGCVQLYHQPSRFVADYFDLGSEIVAFETVDEFAVKVDALLADPAAAETIAAAAQRRVLADHTYKARAETILLHAGLAAPASATRPAA